MRKEFKVEGLSCGPCCEKVEDALNSVDGVRASVSLDPPLAVVVYSGEKLPVEQLKKVVSEVGDYLLVEMVAEDID